MLYTSSEDEIGPFCTKMGINKKWFSDHHQYDLEPGMISTNGAILELYQYIKNTADLNWADGVRCLARFYPDKEHELPVPKVWQSEWKRLQAKRNSKKYAAKKTLRDEWLMEEYQLSNRATPTASVDNIVTEDDPGLKDDGVDETTGVDSDFFHRQLYDSPIKQKLLGIASVQNNHLRFHTMTSKQMVCSYHCLTSKPNKHCFSSFCHLQLNMDQNAGSRTSTECLIDILTDDALIVIFSFLTLYERLMVMRWVGQNDCLIDTLVDSALDWNCHLFLSCLLLTSVLNFMQYD